MVTRNSIDQARGILMERFQMTAEHAFALLTRASREANVELRDLALRLIDAGDTAARELRGPRRAGSAAAPWSRIDDPLAEPSQRNGR